MEFLLEQGYPVLVVTLGYVVLGLTGFASSLIVVPLLSWRWPLAEVVPLALTMDLVASALMGGLNFREVAWGELRRLAPGMVLGGLLGLWLTARLDSHWPLLGLGAYVAWVGVRTLRGPPPGPDAPRPAPMTLGLGYGGAIGFVTLVFGTGGPLVLAWLARRGLDARTMRASTPVIYVLASAAVLALMAAAGRLSNPQLLRWLALLMPVSVVGTLGGHALMQHVPVSTLRRIICLLLVASGLMLAANALVRMI